MKNNIFFANPFKNHELQHDLPKEKLL